MQIVQSFFQNYAILGKGGDSLEEPMHTDATKRLLTESLKRLMAQKPLNKISIREITEGCGLNRQTFYYHFEDIYDQVRWMFRQEAIKLLDQREGILIWQDGLLQLFRYLEENRDVCLCALHSLGHEHLRRFFQSDIYDIIHRVVDQLAENLNTTEEEKDILTHFYISALSGTVESWLLGELPYTPETLVDAADRIIQEHIAGALMRAHPESPPPPSPNSKS